jgi:hypothetical protein
MPSVTYDAQETERMRALHGCRLASFRSRAAAFLLDLAIGGLIFFALVLILLKLTGGGAELKFTTPGRV